MATRGTVDWTTLLGSLSNISYPQPEEPGFFTKLANALQQGNADRNQALLDQMLRAENEYQYKLQQGTATDVDRAWASNRAEDMAYQQYLVDQGTVDPSQLGQGNGWNAVRALPQMAAYALPQVLMGIATGPVAGAIGGMAGGGIAGRLAGSFATSVLPSAIGAAQETGDLTTEVYMELLKQGKSHEEAEKTARESTNSLFATTLGTELLGNMLTFGGAKLFPNAKGIIKNFAKLVANAGMEGAQEIAQGVVTNAHTGNPNDWPALIDEGIVGALASMLPGSIELASSIASKGESGNVSDWEGLRNTAKNVRQDLVIEQQKHDSKSPEYAEIESVIQRLDGVLATPSIKDSILNQDRIDMTPGFMQQTIDAGSDTIAKFMPGVNQDERAQTEQNNMEIAASAEEMQAELAQNFQSAMEKSIAQTPLALPPGSGKPTPPMMGAIAPPVQEQPIYEGKRSEAPAPPVAPQQEIDPNYVVQRTPVEEEVAHMSRDQILSELTSMQKAATRGKIPKVNTPERKAWNERFGALRKANKLLEKGERERGVQSTESSTKSSTKKAPSKKQAVTQNTPPVAPKDTAIAQSQAPSQAQSQAPSQTQVDVTQPTPARTATEDVPVQETEKISPPEQVAPPRPPTEATREEKIEAARQAAQPKEASDPKISEFGMKNLRSRVPQATTAEAIKQEANYAKNVFKPGKNLYDESSNKITIIDYTGSEDTFEDHGANVTITSSETGETTTRFIPMRELLKLKANPPGQKQRSTVGRKPKATGTEINVEGSASKSAAESDKTAPASQVETQPPAPDTQPRSPDVGKSTPIRAGSGSDVVAGTARYKIMEAEDVIDSGDKRYDQQYQLRDRSERVSIHQVNGIANNLDPEKLGANINAAEGAPITLPNGMVLSGNGRTMALKSVYKTEHAEKIKAYKDFIKAHAEEFGITADVDLYKHPILVRELEGSEDAAFVKKIRDKANESDVASFDPTTQAMIDATRISEDETAMMSLSFQDSSITGKAQLTPEFLQAFYNLVPETERHGITQDNRLNQDGIRRAQNAALMLAYQNKQIFEEVVVEEPSVKTLASALLNAAPHFAKLRSLVITNQLPPEINIGDEVAKAALKFKDMRMSGDNVEDALGSIMDINVPGSKSFNATHPLASKMVRVINKMGNSKDNLTRYLTSIAQNLIDRAATLNGVFTTPEGKKLSPRLMMMNAEIKANPFAELNPPKKGKKPVPITETPAPKSRETYLAEVVHEDDDLAHAIYKDMQKGDLIYADDEQQSDMMMSTAQITATTIGHMARLAGASPMELYKTLNLQYEHVTEPVDGHALGAFWVLKDNGYKISLLTESDPEVVLHEHAHLIFETWRQLVAAMENGKMGRNDILISKYHEALDLITKGSDAFNQFDKESGHEAFARAFTKYISEGKTSSPELKSIFERFAAWLREILTKILGIREAGPELNDGQRKVLNWLVAGGYGDNFLYGTENSIEATGNLALFWTESRLENKAHFTKEKPKEERNVTLTTDIDTGEKLKVRETIMSPDMVGREHESFRPIEKASRHSQFQLAAIRIQYGKRVDAITGTRNIFGQRKWDGILKSEKELTDLSDLLLTGDRFQKEYTDAELADMKTTSRPINDNTIKAYKAMRAIYADLWEAVNEARVANGRKPMGKIEGFIPHYLGRFWVYQITNEKGADGKRLRKTVGTFNSWQEAINASENLAGEIVIRQRSLFGDGESAATAALLGDTTAIAIEEQAAINSEVTLEQAKKIAAARKDHKRWREHGRQFIDAFHRKGAVGWNENIEYMVRHYINLASRYIAIDTFNKQAEASFKEQWGDINKDWQSGTVQRYAKDLIADVNGRPTQIENFFNNMTSKVVEQWIKADPESKGFKAAVARFFALRATDQFGAERPFLILTSKFMQLISHAKLGCFNMMSAGLNLTQMIHLNAYLNDASLITSAMAEQAKMPPATRKMLDHYGIGGMIGLESASAYTKLNTLNNASLMLFKKTDNYVKEVAAIALYRKALRDGLKPDTQEMTDFMEQGLTDTMFDYSVAGAPAFIRRLGPIGSMMFQFKKYGLKSLELGLSGKLPLKIQKAKFWGPWLAMSGLFGMPGAKLFTGAISYILKFLMPDDPPDIEKEIKIAIANSGAPSWLKRAALYGAFSNIGVDIGERTGLGDIVPDSAEDFMGPAASTLVKFIRSLPSAFSDGEMINSLAYISPQMANNVRLLMNNREVKDRNGKLRYSYSLPEFLVKWVGAQPLRLSTERDAIELSNYETTSRERKRRNAIEAYVMARQNKDRDAIIEATRGLKPFKVTQKEIDAAMKKYKNASTVSNYEREREQVNSGNAKTRAKKAPERNTFNNVSSMWE